MASIAGVNQAVISLAFQNMKGPITDNIFEQIPLLDYLRSKGHVRQFSGGERLTFPILHASNTTAKSYTKYGILDTTPQEGIGSVEYSWRQYSVSVAVAGLELRQVMNEWAIANLLESKTMQSEMSLADIMNQHSFAAQSGTNLDGLGTLVQSDPTASSTVGGLNQSTNVFWRNQTESGASSTAAFDNLLEKMRAIYNKTQAASKKFGAAEFWVTTRTVFEGYEGLVDSQRQYGNEKLLNLGFENLAFKTAGLMFDNDCTSGNLYALNTETLYLGVHPDADFTPTEMVKPADQDALVGQIIFQGNLVATNRATNGIIHSIT